MRYVCATTMLVVAAVGCGPDTTWQPSFDAESAGWLMNVYAQSSDDVYAVGGSPETGAIHHFDGSSWQAMEVPSEVPLVNWAHGFGVDDVSFVCNEGVAVHWDGAALTAVQTPTEQPLWGVWGAAPDDLWAVGGDVAPDAEIAIVHYDGLEWTDVPIPELDRESTGLFKVWGTAADNVYAVGHIGLVLHWDGTSWTQVLVGAGDDLVSLWGNGPDEIVIAGGRSNGTVSVWDGDEWRTHLLDAGRVPGLNGIWSREPGVYHVAGFRSTLGVVRLNEDIPTFEDTSYGSRTTLHAIHGADGQLHAVGGSIGLLDVPFTGLALRRDLASLE